jgi:hypothetical protein
VVWVVVRWRRGAGAGSNGFALATPVEGASVVWRRLHLQLPPRKSVTYQPDLSETRPSVVFFEGFAASVAHRQRCIGHFCVLA